MIGTNVDGSRRNLSVPTHVPWCVRWPRTRALLRSLPTSNAPTSTSPSSRTGGVMGARVDLSVRWETGPEGMTSSTGDAIVAWRAWESAEENKRRGVPDRLLGGHPAFGDPPKS